VVFFALWYDLVLKIDTSPKSVFRRQKMKQPVFEATPQLSLEASQALLKRIGNVNLSEKRRIELSELAMLAHQAYVRPMNNAAK
jgi:hypothetical protein